MFFIKNTIDDLIQKTQFNDNVLVEQNAINGILGVDRNNKVLKFHLTRENATVAIWGRDAKERYGIINSLLQTVFSQTTPKKLRVVLIDGVVNNFADYQGNPFLYAEPSAGTLDTKYSQNLIANVVSLCQKRESLFRDNNVSSLIEYNIKAKKELPEIWLIIDEWTELIKEDRRLRFEEKNLRVENNLYYLINHSQHLGVRLLLSDSSVRESGKNFRIISTIFNRIIFSSLSYEEQKMVLGENYKLLIKPEVKNVFCTNMLSFDKFYTVGIPIKSINNYIKPLNAMIKMQYQDYKPLKNYAEIMKKE